VADDDDNDDDDNDDDDNDDDDRTFLLGIVHYMKSETCVCVCVFYRALPSTDAARTTKAHSSLPPPLPSWLVVCMCLFISLSHKFNPSSTEDGSIWPRDGDWFVLFVHSAF